MSWRSDDWVTEGIAKSIKDKIELAHGFGFTTAEDYVEAGADALIAAGWRQVPSEEEIKQWLYNHGFYNTARNLPPEIHDWLLEGDKE